MALKLNWDVLGMATSVGCAIHCAILPLVVTTLPFFGVNIIHNSYFEWGMILLAFFVGCISLYHGYKKHHSNFTPLIIFSAGFVCLVFKQFIPALELLLLFFAVSLIVSAHVVNYRHTRRVSRKPDRQVPV